MKKTRALIVIGLVAFAAGGCIFADGRTSPRSVILSVPSADYGLRIEWNGQSSVLRPLTNQTYQFEIPSMHCGTTYWLFLIPHHYVHGEDDPFLFVAERGKEWKTLTPKQILKLPKDETGMAILHGR